MKKLLILAVTVTVGFTGSASAQYPDTLRYLNNRPPVTIYCGAAGKVSSGYPSFLCSICRSYYPDLSPRYMKYWDPR